MKKYCFLLLFIPILSFAQNELNHFWTQSLWMVSPVIDKESKEFLLSMPQDPNKPNIFGQSLIFKPDGTFISKYRLRCGNDCFRHAEGTFKKIDKLHIHLQLHFYRQSSPGGTICTIIEDKNHYDLGIFRIIQTPKGYKLIKTKLK